MTPWALSLASGHANRSLVRNRIPRIMQIGCRIIYALNLLPGTIDNRKLCNGITGLLAYWLTKSLEVNPQKGFFTSVGPKMALCWNFWNWKRCSMSMQNCGEGPSIGNSSSQSSLAWLKNQLEKKARRCLYLNTRVYPCPIIDGDHWQPLTTMVSCEFYHRSF